MPRANSLSLYSAISMFRIKLISASSVFPKSHSGIFTLTIRELFDLDSIRLGISLENYGRLGGQDGVIKSLKSDEIRGIDVLYEEETRAR